MLACMHVYMYVCMYKCGHVYMFAYTCACKYAYIMCDCTSAFIYDYVHCMCMRNCVKLLLLKSGMVNLGLRPSLY